MPSPKLRRRRQINLLTRDQELLLVIGPTVRQVLGLAGCGFASEPAMWAAWRTHREELLRGHDARDVWAARAIRDPSIPRPAFGELAEVVPFVRPGADVVDEP